MFVGKNEKNDKNDILKITIFILISVLFANPVAQQYGTCGTAQVSQNLPQISNAQKITNHNDDEVGDIVTFFVRDDVFASPPNFIEIEFVMKYGDEKLSIYAETESWANGAIDDDGIFEIAETFLDSTPAEENRGALEIEEEYFGYFPDVDGNGKLFVLIMDINDGENQPGETYIAGYFDPSDQSGSSGNHADILFLDCAHNQFSDDNYEAVLSTAVHELQHLIHHNYDQNEEIWLNEGLSEYAPRLCGFPQRSFSTYLAEPEKSLTSWDGEIADYSRVSLFVTYLAKRFGESILAGLVQRVDNGINSVGNAAVYFENGITGGDIFHDWTLANLLNEPSGNYGYFGEEIPNLSPNIVHSEFPVDETISVQNWSAQFIKLKDGRVLSISTDGSVDLALVYNGNIEIVNPANFEFSDSLFGVEYDEFYLIPSYVGSGQSRQFSYFVEASGGTEEIIVSYNDGDEEFVVGLGSLAASVYFERPQIDATLGKIRVFCGKNSATEIVLKSSLQSQTPFFFTTVVTNESAWTEIETEPFANESFFIEISSANNSLGYDDSQSGDGFSFFDGANLANYQVELEGESVFLTGNWMIEAVFYKPIGPKLSVSKTDLNFYGWREELFFLIENSGEGDAGI